MKIKKKIAAAVSAVFAVSVMALNVFAAQDTSGLSDGTAYLNINNDQWSEFDADWKNVMITGNGKYTVSMTSAEEVNLAQFNALEIVNGDVVFGRTYTVTIDSVKVNGVEKKIADGYTCSADSKGITTRVNIYNEWNSPDETKDDSGNFDCRSADGDFMSKSAKLISDSDLLGVKSIEVTFTAAGIGGSSASSGANGNSGSPEASAGNEENSGSTENSRPGTDDASTGAGIKASETEISAEAVPAADTAAVIVFAAASVGIAVFVSVKKDGQKEA